MLTRSSRWLGNNNCELLTFNSALPNKRPSPGPNRQMFHQTITSPPLHLQPGGTGRRCMIFCKRAREKFRAKSVKTQHLPIHDLLSDERRRGSALLRFRRVVSQVSSPFPSPRVTSYRPRARRERSTTGGYLNRDDAPKKGASRG